MLVRGSLPRHLTLHNDFRTMTHPLLQIRNTSRVVPTRRVRWLLGLNTIRQRAQFTVNHTRRLLKVTRQPIPRRARNHYTRFRVAPTRQVNRNPTQQAIRNQNHHLRLRINTRTQRTRLRTRTLTRANRQPPRRVRHRQHTITRGFHNTTRTSTK